MRLIRVFALVAVVAACSSDTAQVAFTTTTTVPTVTTLATTTTLPATTTAAPAATSTSTTASPTTTIDIDKFVTHNVEELPGITTSPGLYTTVQDMTAWDNGYAWGGLSQLFLGSAVGDWIEFVVPIQVGGDYEVELWLTRAPDFGIVRVTIDGVDTDEIDLYGPEVRATQGLSMGEFTLAAGPHTVRLTVIGKSPLSADTKVGIDTITIIGPN